MRVEILPIFTNLYQEIPDGSNRETYPVHIWLDMKQREAWAESDKESLADSVPHIYSWKIPLMSDARTMSLMQALKSRFVMLIENHIQESALTRDAVKNQCHWKLNSAGMQAKCDIDRYLELFCSSVDGIDL